MNKPITLIISLITILFMNTAAAQDNLAIAEAKGTKRDTRILNIISLDGKNKKVKITPDYVKKKLRITCLKDTISIVDFWGMTPEIRMLNKKFIKIRYAVRGGSNLGLEHTVILCINGSKLYEAMHVLNYCNWDSGDLKANYHIKLILSGDHKNNYRLHVRIHDAVYSKRNPETNYNYNNQTVLSFDTRQHVFYSVKEYIHDHHIKADTGKTPKQKINGNSWVTILGKETYYFINNQWYQLGLTNEMNEFK